MLHGGNGIPGRPAIRRATLAAMGFLVALPSGARVQTLAPPASERAGGCRVTEAGRDTLAFADGRVAYVEAQTLVADGGAVLLAGSPAYVFARRAGGDLVHRPDDAIAGVVIGPDGTARPIPPPLAGRPATQFRATSLGDGRWGAVFIETEPGSEFPDEVPVAPWYGTFDGQRWTSLERLPVPEGEVSLFPVSSLKRRGERLAWALTVDREPSWGEPVVYTRAEGTWSRETWPFNVTYVDVAVSDGGGVVAALVRSDTTLPRDGNSLFLYAADRLQRVALGRDQPVHEPSLVLGPTGALTWYAIVPSGETFRHEARAVVGDLPWHGGPVLRLDPDVHRIGYLPTPAGRPLWLADHVSSTENRSLRLIGLTAGRPSVLWEAPSPYEGSAAGIALTEREVIVAGPRVDRSGPSLVTLLIRLDLDCPAPPESGG